MAPNDNPSYRDHPRYQLRRFSLICSISGIILSIPALSPYQHRDLSDQFLAVIFWLVCSVAVCVWDLVDWKLKKASSLLGVRGSSAERRPLLATATATEEDDAAGDGDQDDKPDRPRMLLFFLDLFLAIALFLVWTATLSSLTWSFAYRQYFDQDDAILMISCSYVSFTVLMTSLTHLLCMWQEFMAIKKTDWEQTLRRDQWRWEDRLNRMVAAAIQPRGNNETGRAEPIHTNAHHTCACHAGELHDRVQEENRIIERIMRVLGKVVDQPDLLSRENNQDPAAAVARAYNPYDVEAGPSCQHEPLLTPEHSVSVAEDGPEPVESSHTGAEGVSQHASVVGETSSEGVEAVLVKKKAKKGKGGKGKEKEKEKEKAQETVEKIEEEDTEED